MKNKFAISLVTLLVSGTMMTAPVVANAAVETSTPSVAASRSFTAVSERDNDLLTESSSVSVSGDTKWENTESLKVEQVKSPAEIAEEEAQKKAAEEYAAQQEELAKQQAQAEAAAQQQAASRNQTRTSQADESSSSNASDAAVASAAASATTPAASSVASSAKGATMVSAALSHMGQAMWCTDLVTAALAAVGVNFSGWPADYANIPGGVQVGDISAAQPGDVLVYGNSHVAIYMGNGQAVHGGWGGYPNVGTGSATGTSAGVPTAIVRIP